MVEPFSRRPLDVVVGKGQPRRELKRLLNGSGRYVDDIKLPRMLHLAFVRSPYAYARIHSFDLEAAKRAPGVVAVFTGEDLNAICKPLIGIALHRPGHRAPPQHLMAGSLAFWQGQTVAAVVASSRAEAEDAADLVVIDWEELSPIVTAQDALDKSKGAIHAELGDNVAYDFSLNKGDVNQAFADAAVVVEDEFQFERQLGLTLEPRGLIADYRSSDNELTVYHSHQSPFQMQEVFSRHFDIPEQNVRVQAPDVGGGFGMKINIYAEELAVVAASILVGRPIKFIADRLESFLTDAHARDHLVKARMAVSEEGRITAMEVDDLAAIGAFGMQMRFNIAEGMMVIALAGAPYDFSNYRARTQSVYVNKNIIGMYRGVGLPIACVITELLADRAASALGMDPIEFRRRNYIAKESLPRVTVGGQRLETVSFHRCLDDLVRLMDYDGLRKEQRLFREKGIYRGIGVATFVEQTAFGPHYYGPSGANISTQDGCSLRLEPSGVIRCITSITDQGQGTLTGIAQIVADGVGVRFDDIGVLAGDSAISPYGGGAWASRGMAIGGEAALKASALLKRNILSLASAITQTPASDLDLVDSQVINTITRMGVISLADVARIGYFRQDTLPPGFEPQLYVSETFVGKSELCYFANGVHASYVEVDLETGFIKVLGHWAADDCGRIINPLLVDEQLRGGIVQGIGAILFEECLYSDQGQFQNGSMAEYLVPTACDVPDIKIAHVETPEASTQLGAKGIGEAGVIGAMGAVWAAVNDAVAPLGVKIQHQPFTPERVLDAIGRRIPKADATYASR